MAEREPALAGFRCCHDITSDDGFYLNHMYVNNMRIATIRS
ncbi:hypothetical protein HMPREF1167_02378 [Aeromonas veronii AER39]|nr:hypothetical protein HMPREF1167_02378 [Aeromonas veronii AER39]